MHSYKGGTGKTTIACNLASLLSRKGYRVALLDMDIYTPSVGSYFGYTPKYWINNLLTDNNKMGDVLVDMTGVLGKNHSNEGRLWIGYANPRKEAIYKLDGLGLGKDSRTNSVRKFIRMKEELIADYDCDYILFDTSPGIRYWSINCLTVTDTVILTLKFGDFDLSGTRRMIDELYSSLMRHGTASYLLLNLVAGYCVPSIHGHEDPQKDGNYSISTSQNEDPIRLLSRQVAMDLITSIPCYCDLQFARKEFLTVLQNPNHPFARQIQDIASSQAIAV